ncbi:MULTISPECIES: hypothetical protein [Oscillatoriales]|nr:MULTISPECIES: hypothetical protein [Oscillatoriales]KDR54426.1 hypothetical protein APPUASWS_028280 [Arthrospira platensis str. Paraca]MDT9311696.1 hypothetical protein [Limnospira sp. Paracas R14]TVU52757.1 MAG: hypothetical protein EA414_15805 [Arthrospira sp. PLM2.Bin9]
MQYTFNLVGVSPILSFFYQQQQQQEQQTSGIEYLGHRQCTLDMFLESVEMVASKRGWQCDRVVDTVINFWMNNSESIQYWKGRLEDAGHENLLVARVADLKSLRTTFESLLDA